FRLYDMCLENDGAAAMILVPAERARDLRQPPAYLLGAAQGSEYRAGATWHNNPDYATSAFKTLAPRLYAMAGVGPEEVDVVQSYENFTGGVVMALIEHGFCTYESANEFLTLENLIAPNGKLPLNTSGGNLAECYMHGLGLNIEAVRQIRGQSSNQVPDAELALVNSGPMVTNATNMIVGSEATL
ncbi:MAG: acetyl-CoA acetyltransferase, partial [Deltaproteobacteria bacterium]|nr:acetyl-CoA acetyltransferase [Deltaproteobacteria bacterium]